MQCAFKYTIQLAITEVPPFQSLQHLGDAMQWKRAHGVRHACNGPLEQREDHSNLHRACNVKGLKPPLQLAKVKGASKPSKGQRSPFSLSLEGFQAFLFFEAFEVPFVLLLKAFGGFEGGFEALHAEFTEHFRALTGLHNESNHQMFKQSCNQLPDATTRSRIFCDHYLTMCNGGLTRSRIFCDHLTMCNGGRVCGGTIDERTHAKEITVE